LTLTSLFTRIGRGTPTCLTWTCHPRQKNKPMYVGCKSAWLPHYYIRMNNFDGNIGLQQLSAELGAGIHGKDL
jgi:hypothetical protein